MIEKPHRYLLDRISSYAEEGVAYLRRRRHRARAHARVWSATGEVRDVDLQSPAGRRLAAVAEALLDEEGGRGAAPRG